MWVDMSAARLSARSSIIVPPSVRLPTQWPLLIDPVVALIVHARSITSSAWHDGWWSLCAWSLKYRQTWQPLRKIVRRETVQRMDICQRNVRALTRLGKDERGKGVLKTGEPAGPRTQDPRLKRSKRWIHTVAWFCEGFPVFLCEEGLERILSILLIL